MKTEDTDQPEGGESRRGFALKHDVTVGGTVLLPAGTFVAVRKPLSGSLRGLKMLELSQLDTASLETLAPRITQPVITKQAAAALDPEDLMSFGGEVLGFLFPGAASEASSIA